MVILGLESQPVKTNLYINISNTMVTRIKDR